VNQTVVAIELLQAELIAFLLEQNDDVLVEILFMVFAYRRPP